MRRRPDRRGRIRSAPVVVVLVVMAVGLVIVAGATRTAAAVPLGRSALARSTQGVTLLGQSTWVGDDSVFDLRLGLTGRVAASDHIEVTAYSRITARNDFDLAADGRLGQEYPVWIGEETVGAAPPARGGGVWAHVPVNTRLTSADLGTQEAFDPGSESGVYLLRIQLLGTDYSVVGRAISTFLVYSDHQAGFPKLAAAVTVPVSATPSLSSKLVPTPLARRVSSNLATVSLILATHPGVAVSLAVAPQTAQALASGSGTDHATLALLSDRVREGAELLPEPYAPVSLATLAASGLADEIPGQLRQGRATLRTTLGVAPRAGTWVISDPIDEPTIQVLRTDGLRQVVVPGTALDPLPARLTCTTYGQPTALDDGADAVVPVVGTDTVLTGRVTQDTGAVLAAEQTLAELAMIELETPSVVRGVAVTLPGGPVPTTYLQTLLTGLRDNPFVRPVTVAGLFGAVPAVPVARRCDGASGRPDTIVPVQHLAPAIIATVADAGTLRRLDRQIRGVAQMLPADRTLIARLRRQLLVAPESGLSPSRRQSLLAGMDLAVTTAGKNVHLPGAASVTLTSLRATLPLTVLSTAGVLPHVRLTLDSPKLEFRTFRPPDGTCKVTGRTHEVCEMVLHGPQTALRVPVVARTSGVFTLDVVITSPNGSLVLAEARDTVRSTAVSFVGIVIIVVSLLFLGIWWGRDIHSGRRARQLVDRPDDGDIDGGDIGGGEPGGGGGGGGGGGPPGWVGPGPSPAPVAPPEPPRPRFPLPATLRAGPPGPPRGVRRMRPLGDARCHHRTGRSVPPLGAVTDPRSTRHERNPCRHRQCL